MPYRQKGSPYWYISYTDAGGKRIKESAETTSKAEAGALESKRRLDVRGQRKWGDAPQYTFDQLLTRYLKETADKKSHSRDLTSALPLTEFFSGKVINAIAGDDITDYKKKRTEASLSKATIVKEMYLLSAAIRHAKKHWDWKLENPITGRAPKVNRRMPRWLSREEIGAFIEAAEGIAARRFRTSPVVVDYARLSIATGMRSGEALGLEWARVDFGARMIYFDVDDQKSGIPGSIPLNDSAIEVLRARQAYCQEHCPDTRWVFCHATGTRILSLKKAVATAARRAKLQRVTPHTFRHTFGAMMTQKGVPIRLVCELMRHADIRTTMIYAHLAPHNGREVIGLMDSVFPRAKTVRPNLGAQQDTAGQSWPQLAVTA